MQLHGAAVRLASSARRAPLPVTEVTSMSETPTERNRRIFEEATARGEPVFVVRAQDVQSVAAIQCYRGLSVTNVDPDFVQALDDLAAEFQHWQRLHPSQMKLPDLR